MGVADWLNPAPRPASSFSFEVTDLKETSAVPSSTELADLLVESYWGKAYFADLANRYGFGAVRDKFLGARASSRPTVRRGDFGEAVTVEYLKEVNGYCVPVPKLRYKISANQTLPGTDCIALRISNDELVEVVYVESKLRTSPDSSVAITGTRQLKEDADSANSVTLTFMARRLQETNHSLTNLFVDYLFERNTSLDKYLLVLICEDAIWSEHVLGNLEDEEIDLEPLHVYVARVMGLKNLSDKAFSVMGAEVDDD